MFGEVGFCADYILVWNLERFAWQERSPRYGISGGRDASWPVPREKKAEDKLPEAFSAKDLRRLVTESARACRYASRGERGDDGRLAPSSAAKKSYYARS